MNPVLTLDLGGLEIVTTAYRFFLLVAATAAVGSGLAVAAMRGLDLGRSLICICGCAVAVPVGARLLDLVTKPDLYRGHMERLFSTDLTGFSMYGGLLLATATGAGLSRLLSFDLARMADSVAPGLGIAIALVRIGCFEAGCCFGTACELPWGVTFPRGSEAHVYQLLGSGWLGFAANPRPVHPVQLYEAGTGVALALVAVVFMRRRARDGTAFLSLATGYCAFRLLTHWVRVPGPSLAVPEWFYPALYLAVGCSAAAAMILRSRRVSAGPCCTGGPASPGIGSRFRAGPRSAAGRQPSRSSP